MDNFRKQVLIGGLGIAGIVAVAFGIVAYFRPEPVMRVDEGVFKRSDEAVLTPSATGPWPKMVLESEAVDFGNVYEGEELAKTFRILNQGEAPLRLVVGRAICDCEILTAPKDAVPPGGSVELTMIWRPKPSSEMFRKHVEFFSDDPEHLKFTVGVGGSALPLYMAAPQGDWKIPSVNEFGVTKFTGMVMSPAREDFTISQIDLGDAPMDCEIVNMERATVDGVSQGRPGKQIVLSLRPEMPLGPFAYPIVIHTNIPGLRRINQERSDSLDISVLVTGERRGPFRILGRGWYSETKTLSLGTFSSKEGKTAKVLFFCEDDSNKDVEVTGVECDEPSLRFELVRDTNFKGKGIKYDLIVTFAAGQTPVNRQDDGEFKVRVKTTHKTCPEYEFTCNFNAS